MRRFLASIAFVLAVAGFTAATPGAAHADGGPTNCTTCHG